MHFFQWIGRQVTIFNYIRSHCIVFTKKWQIFFIRVGIGIVTAKQSGYFHVTSCDIKTNRYSILQHRGSTTMPFNYEFPTLSSAFCCFSVQRCASVGVEMQRRRTASYFFVLENDRNHDILTPVCAGNYQLFIANVESWKQWSNIVIYLICLISSFCVYKHIQVQWRLNLLRVSESVYFAFL